MNIIEERLNAVEARLTARAAELEQRIAARFGREEPAKSAEKGGTTRPAGSLYGLFFGVGTYSPQMGIKPCPRFAEDVQNLRNACVKFGRWRPENVFLRLNEQATVRGIGTSLAEMAARARPGDLVLVCISTHGGRKKGAPAGDDTYLCAHDGPYPESRLRADLGGFAAGVRVVFLLESCHAAGMFEKGDAASDEEALDAASLDRMLSSVAGDSRSGDGRLRPEDFGWIAAAAADQSSLYFGGSGNLMLSHTLLNEGWIGGGADGFVHAVVSRNGEQAVMSPDALLRVREISPAPKTGEVSFLDLAAFSTWRWKDVSDNSSNRHIPRFGNAPLLSGILAGATGPATSREERPAGVREAAPSPARPSSGARYGLYVGVNRYAVPCSPLHGCVPDARNMAAVCRELGGWEAADQIILVDDAATVDAVRSSLRSLAEKALPGDTVLYFQSSHGGPNGQAPASNDTCLWCHDGRYPEADLWADLSRFRKDVRLVVVVDACYSGGLFQRSAVPVESLSGNVLARFREKPQPADRISPDTIGWITAAANGETSLDHPSAGGGYFATFTLVNNGWRGGMADGFVDALLSAPGRTVGSLTGLPRPTQPVVPARSNGFVTFLDLAAFAIVTWGNWQTADGTSHVPQCLNEKLLHSVVAGRVGTAPDRNERPPAGNGGGSPKDTIYHLYCDKCGHRWYSSHWDNYCPKFGCTGRAHKL